MRADLGALLDHDHAEFRRDLLQPDGGGEPGRPGADDDHVEFHGFAGGHVTRHDVQTWRSRNLSLQWDQANRAIR